MLKQAVFLTFLPVVAFAERYDGTYRQTANSECGLVGVDGGALQIKDGIFYGVGMECRMTDPVEVDNMSATLYVMECSGEDEQWSERAFVMNAAENEGLIMAWDGYAFRYERCTDPDAVVEAATEVEIPDDAEVTEVSAEAD